VSTSTGVEARGHAPRKGAICGSPGIDIAAETHVLAVVDEAGTVLIKSTPFAEDAGGYTRLLERLGAPAVLLVIMEATCHYWKNPFATQAAHGAAVVLINPLRTDRFAEEDLGRTKTDGIDAVGLARFGAQKRPPATRLPATETDELRELVRLRDRLVQDFGNRVRQLQPRCAPSSGCRSSPLSGRAPGCVPTTSVSAPAASCRRSRSSRRCGNC
jgi:transposase